MARGIGLARAKPLVVRWSELAPMMTGQSVTLTLTDGMQVKGQAVAVREDALLCTAFVGTDSAQRHTSHIGNQG
jgi:hypothetical protein